MDFVVLEPKVSEFCHVSDGCWDLVDFVVVEVDSALWEELW